jgi:hypothetical protein
METPPPLPLARKGDILGCLCIGYIFVVVTQHGKANSMVGLIGMFWFGILFWDFHSIWGIHCPGNFNWASSVGERIFPKMIFSPLLATSRFFTPIVALLRSFFPILHLFLSFYFLFSLFISPFSFFFPLPFGPAIFPFFLVRFLYFFL